MDGSRAPVGVAEAVAGAVRALVPGAELYLYGSRARGDARPDSDWDFMVVVPPSFDERRELEATVAIRARAEEALGGPAAAPLHLVWCRDHVWRHEPLSDLSVNSLVYNARVEARRIL